MEKSGMKDCTFEGKTYSHNSEVCRDEKCMICRDGEWKEEPELFPSKEPGTSSS